MKTGNIIGLCAACLLTGFALSWAYVRSHMVQLAPFDPSLYEKMVIDPGVPLYSVSTDRTNWLCWTFGSTPTAPQNLGLCLRMLGKLNAEETFPIVMDTNWTVSQVMDLMAFATECNVHSVKVLIPDGAHGSGSQSQPLFQELRIGPARSIPEQHYDWYLESKQKQVPTQA